MVAVIPDNQDSKMMINPVDPNFWGKVRAWQTKKWWIALHGHTHQMRETTAKQILPFYPHSEFSGLSYRKQAQKIDQALAIFKANRVKPTLWIAPGHCFDETTVTVLRDRTNIKIISDSIALNVYFKNGMFWLPQQLWGFKKCPLVYGRFACTPIPCRKNISHALRRKLPATETYF